MHNNKLLKLLAQLSAKEIKEFHSYVKRLFPNNSALNRLLEYLKKAHPDFSKDKLDSRKAHSYVFKEVEFKQQNINNAISDVRKELKRFLVWRYQEEFPYERDFLLLQLYKKLKAEKHFDQQLVTTMKGVEKQRNDIWYWLKKMRIAHEYYYDPKKEQINVEGQKLEAIMVNLDLFYTAAKLKYASEFYNRNALLKKTPPNLIFLEEVMNKNWESSLLHYCFQLVIQLLQTRKNEIYFKLKKIIIDNLGHFSAENLNTFFSYLINHHAYLNKGGAEINVEELLELYKYGIECRAFVVNGVFNVSHYNNIVDLACKLKEFDWLEEFNKNCSCHLPESISESTFRLSSAFILFAQEEYGEVISILLSTYPKGIHNEVRYRCLEIASNYEKHGGADRVIQLCLACEQFTRRNKKMNSQMQRKLLNFTKIVKKLCRGKVEISKEELWDDLAQYEGVYFGSWVTQKISLF